MLQSDERQDHEHCPARWQLRLSTLHLLTLSTTATSSRRDWADLKLQRSSPPCFCLPACRIYMLLYLVIRGSCRIDFTSENKKGRCFAPFFSSHLRFSGTSDAALARSSACRGSSGLSLRSANGLASNSSLLATALRSGKPCTRFHAVAAPRSVAKLPQLPLIPWHQSSDNLWRLDRSHVEADRQTTRPSEPVCVFLISFAVSTKRT